MTAAGEGSGLPSLRPEWRAFLEAYRAAYFERRDPEATLALLDPALTGFGTGADETGRRPGEMTDLYRRDLEQSRAPMQAWFDWVEGRAVGEDGAVLGAVLSVRIETAEGPMIFEGMRLSLVLERRDGVWRMVHHHLSLPTSRQEPGESLPFQELRTFVARLQGELQASNQELETQNRALRQALEEVRTLSGLIPICAGCKKIRDDRGYWNEVEEYLSRHAPVEFTHGLCPPCIERLYPGHGRKRNPPGSGD